MELPRRRVGARAPRRRSQRAPCRQDRRQRTDDAVVSNAGVCGPEGGGLLEITEEGKTLVALGTNFLDEQESDLRTRGPGEGGAFAARTAGSMETGATSDPLFWILLGTVVAAVLANWCLPGVE